jgi:hypothetical protein
MTCCRFTVSCTPASMHPAPSRFRRMCAQIGLGTCVAAGSRTSMCSTAGRRSTGQASWVDRLPVMCCRFSRTRDQGDGAPRRRARSLSGRPAALRGRPAPTRRPVGRGCQPDQYGIGTWVQTRASQDQCCRTNPVQALGSGVSGDPDRLTAIVMKARSGQVRNRPVCGRRGQRALPPRLTCFLARCCAAPRPGRISSPPERTRAR